MEKLKSCFPKLYQTFPKHYQKQGREHATKMRMKYRPIEKALYSYKANEWALSQLHEQLQKIEEHGDLNIQNYAAQSFGSGYADRVFELLHQKEVIMKKIADLTKQVEGVRLLRKKLNSPETHNEEFRRDALAILEHGYIEGNMKHESIVKLKRFRIRRLRIWLIKQTFKLLNDKVLCTF